MRNEKKKKQLLKLAAIAAKCINVSIGARLLYKIKCRRYKTQSCNHVIEENT